MKPESTEIDDLKKNWPMAGDILFRPQQRLRTGHTVSGKEAWEHYANGYEEAARILVQSVLADCSTTALVYPVAYLYRQAIELRLKELIVSGQELLDEHPDLKFEHKFSVLWQSCRRILEKVYEESPPEDLLAVQSCLQQFDAVDPISMAFRYPVDKKLEKSLPTLEGFDVEHFANVCGRILYFCECASAGISEYLERKRQFEMDHYASSRW